MKKGKFDHFYNENFTRIMMQVYNLIGDMETARELTQDVFVDLFLNLGKINDLHHAGKWINVTSRNRAFQHLRRAKALTFVRLSDESLSLEEHLPQLNLPFTFDEIKDLFPERDQKIVKLKFLGASFKEISRALDIPQGSVRYLFLKAMERLKAYLKFNKQGLENKR